MISTIKTLIDGAFTRTSIIVVIPTIALIIISIAISTDIIAYLSIFRCSDLV